MNKKLILNNNSNKVLVKMMLKFNNKIILKRKLLDLSQRKDA